MNFSTIALILLALQLLSNGQGNTSTPPPRIGLTDLLSDDAKNMLNCVDKLSTPCPTEDKTGALLQMMTNPAVMNIASSLFGGQQSAPTAPNPPTDTPPQDEHVNSEGYRFETPSATSQEFFRQIDNIADSEVKHKLYWFYDNWYVK